MLRAAQDSYAGRQESPIACVLTWMTWPNTQKTHCIVDLADVTYPKIYAWVLKDVKKHAVPKPYKHPHGAITWVKLDKPMSAESVVDDSPLPMPEGSGPTAL